MPLVCGVVAVKLISPVVEAGNGSVVDSVVGNGGATIEGRLSPSETNGVLLVGRSGIVIQVVGSTWHSRARVRSNVGVARNTAGALSSNSNGKLIALVVGHAELIVVQVVDAKATLLRAEIVVEVIVRSAGLLLPVVEISVRSLHDVARHRHTSALLLRPGQAGLIVVNSHLQVCGSNSLSLDIDGGHVRHDGTTLTTTS